MTEHNGNGAGPQAGGPPRLTPELQKLYAALSPCVPVRAAELQRVLGDELAGNGTLRTQLTYLRRRLRPSGEDVATHIVDGTTYYQLVRLTASPYRD